MLHTEQWMNHMAVFTPSSPSVKSTITTTALAAQKGLPVAKAWHNVKRCNISAF
jgi:hypothetical protein